jgi:hypothetical protein
VKLWMVGDRALAVLLVLLASLHGAAAADARAADASVRTFLDRTAIFVADPVTYTIEITCAPGVDVLDDDLSRDRLKVEGLEVTGTETTRDAGAGGTTVRRFRYHLTTYRVDQRALKIDGMSVRYYRKRPGQGLESATPAGEAQVPDAIVAFRSVLPDDQETYLLRDRRAAAVRPRLAGAAQPIGVGLVVASIVPALLWMIALVRARRPATDRRSSRQVQQEERTSLESVRAIDLSAADLRRDAYTKINALVRDHLHDVCGIAGRSLTPAEIGPALSSRATRIPVETVAALLAACDAARYAPAELLPSADACRAAIDQAAQVIAVR